MKLVEIRELAKQHGIKAGRMNKTELIRAIQQKEHNDPCFATAAVANCGQDACLWREDCT